MFNAIKYTKDLESAGFSREQAEATFNMLYGFSENNLATKQDVTELRHAIETLEYKITVKFGAMLSIAVGLIVTLQKVL